MEDGQWLDTVNGQILSLKKCTETLQEQRFWEGCTKKLLRLFEVIMKKICLINNPKHQWRSQAHSFGGRKALAILGGSGGYASPGNFEI